MNESGIDSFDEFVLFYLFAGCIVGLLWAVLEADVVLGPIDTYGRRHARRLRLTRWLAPLGVVHIAFALIALDATRAPSEVSIDSGARAVHRRAVIEAGLSLALGVVLLLLVTGPHLPVLQELPAVDALARSAPWE